MTRNKNKNKSAGNQQKNSSQSKPARPQVMPNVSGHGGYVADAARTVGQTIKSLIPKGSFSQIGQAGGSVFGPLGGKLGALLGGKIANIAGFGAYKVSQNSLVARVDEGVDLPQFHNSEHATIIRHREFIQDLTAVGGASFSNTSFSLNPGLASTFPFLAQIAVNFESYQILGMIFEYRSTSADITAGGALGSVVLATEYSTVNPPYSSKLVMENAEYSMSCRPSRDIVHAVECDPAVTFSPIKFVRNASVPTGADSRLYDWGNFQVATVGLPTSSGNLGELWVSYEVALFKPSLDLSPALGAADHIKLSSALSTAHYFGPDSATVLRPTVGSSLGGTCAGSTYYFPPALIAGNYLITYCVTGPQTTLSSTLNWGPFNNVNLIQLFANGSNLVETSASATTNVTSMIAVYLQGPGAFITIGSGSLPSTITGGDLFVQRLPVGF